MIHSYVAWYLGYFYMLATVNSSGMNKDMHIILHIKVYLFYFSGDNQEWNWLIIEKFYI